MYSSLFYVLPKTLNLYSFSSQTIRSNTLSDYDLIHMFIVRKVNTKLHLIFILIIRNPVLHELSYSQVSFELKHL